MLRNTGVNVTERRIRQDVQRAYDYEYVDARRARRAWRRYGPHEECQQPKYFPIPRPFYYHGARSSITSYGIGHGGPDRRVYGVRRVYLPEADWGGGSAESRILIRNPRYMEPYYPRETCFDVSGAERFTRDIYDDQGYYRRTSSICFGDHHTERLLNAERYGTVSSKYVDRRPVRKATKKLSPILTCDGTSRQLKTNGTSHSPTKMKNNHLSKEARQISLDICKILSLLRKADADEEEQYSSDSLLQRIHDLECQSSGNVDPRQNKLITECVQIFPKMGKRKKQDDPLAKLRTASGVRSRLEALVSALKQYEAEKAVAVAGSSNAALLSPSMEAGSYSKGKNAKSSTNKIEEGKGQKDIVAQTEEPQMSNKSVCGKIKTKKESSIIKIHKESGKEKIAVKESEGKKIFFFKKKSKDLTQSDKIVAKISSKQGLASNRGEAKAGLMIRIGGNAFRKKQGIIEKQEKIPKSWIKKFLDSKKDSKDNTIHLRWNNRAFGTKSSSTVVELISNVYKQMGIHIKSKGDDKSMSKISEIRKSPKKSTRKTSKSKILKSSKTKIELSKTKIKSSKSKIQKLSKKTRNLQKLEAYMMPETVIPGPVYMPVGVVYETQNDQTKNENLRSDTKVYLQQNSNIQKEFAINSNYVLNMTNDPSSNFFRIYMPMDFFDSASTSNEELEKVIEYETIKSDLFHKHNINNVSGGQKCKMRAAVSVKKDVHRDAKVQVSYARLRFLKRSETRQKIVNQRGHEHEITKPRIQIQEFDETFPKSRCTLAEKFLQEDYRNLMHMGVDYLPCSADRDRSGARAVTMHDQGVGIRSRSDIPKDLKAATTKQNSTQTKSSNRVLLTDSAEVYTRRINSFRNKSKSSEVESIFVIRWKDRDTGEITGFLGRKTKKHVTPSLVDSLFWGLLEKDKCMCRCTEKKKTTPRHLYLRQASDTPATTGLDIPSEPQYPPGLEQFEPQHALGTLFPTQHAPQVPYPTMISMPSYPTAPQVTPEAQYEPHMQYPLPLPTPQVIPNAPKVPYTVPAPNMTVPQIALEAPYTPPVPLPSVSPTAPGFPPPTLQMKIVPRLSSLMPQVPFQPPPLVELRRPSVAQVSSATQLPLAPQVPSAPQKPLRPKVPSVSPVPSAPQIPLLPQVPSVPQVPSAPQIPLIPKVLSVPPVPSAPQIPLILKVLSVPPVPSAPQIPLLPKVPSVPPLPSAPQIPLIPRVPSVPQVHSVRQIPLTPQVPSVPQIPLLPQVPSVPQVPSAPQIPLIPKVLSVPPVPSAPQIPLIPYVLSVPPVPSAPQIPLIPKVLSVPPVPSTPQIPLIPKVPSVPPLPSAPQIPLIPRVPSVPQVHFVPQIPLILQAPSAPKTSLSPQVPSTSQVPFALQVPSAPQPQTQPPSGLESFIRSEDPDDKVQKVESEKPRVPGSSSVRQYASNSKPPPEVQVQSIPKPPLTPQPSFYPGYLPFAPKSPAKLKIPAAPKGSTRVLFGLKTPPTSNIYPPASKTPDKLPLSAAPKRPSAVKIPSAPKSPPTPKSPSAPSRYSPAHRLLQTPSALKPVTETKLKVLSAPKPPAVIKAPLEAKPRPKVPSAPKPKTAAIPKFLSPYKIPAATKHQVPSVPKFPVETRPQSDRKMPPVSLTEPKVSSAPKHTLETKPPSKLKSKVPSVPEAAADAKLPVEANASSELTVPSAPKLPIEAPSEPKRLSELKAPSIPKPLTEAKPKVLSAPKPVVKTPVETRPKLKVPSAPNPPTAAKPKVPFASKIPTLAKPKVPSAPKSPAETKLHSEPKVPFAPKVPTEPNLSSHQLNHHLNLNPILNISSI